MLTAAVTNAPLIVDIFHNLDFIFNCPYQFKDRFNGEKDYFEMSQTRYPLGRTNIWETNFIADVNKAGIDRHDWKAAGGGLTAFEIASNTLVGHLVDWPVGRYHKAHYHGAGAILLILASEGYTLMWPNDLGIHPYQDGHGDQVVRVDWKAGTAFGPPNAGFISISISATRRRSSLRCATEVRSTKWAFMSPRRNGTAGSLSA